MEPFTPRSIGRYALLAPFASGGMARLHFGRLRGPAGFGRLVAIKCLHPFLAEDAEAVAMFLDEARLAARVNHLNVVKTLDVVMEGEGSIFLVLEYIAGASLYELVKDAEAKTRRRALPPGVAVAIVDDVLRGLHAAHEAKSESGEPLLIVHRDVSPQNCLVGQDGVTRVMDFGIATARVRQAKTREGAVKGKLSYMAPEQIRGNAATAATDLYAAAVLLWESLTGRRLVQDGDTASIAEQILLSDHDPPSRYAKEVPPALDEVVLRGLARKPEDRFPSARAMAGALCEAFTRATSSEIASWVQATAGDQLAERAAMAAEAEKSFEAMGEVTSDPMVEMVTPIVPRASGTPPPAVTREARSRPRATSIAALSLVVFAALGLGVTIGRLRNRAPSGDAAASSPSPSAAMLADPTPSASDSSASLPPAPLTSTVTSDPLRAAKAAPRHAPRVDCTVPFVMDADGHKHYRRECLGK